jgi:hypothetical protein
MADKKLKPAQLSKLAGGRKTGSISRKTISGRNTLLQIRTNEGFEMVISRLKEHTSKSKADLLHEALRDYAIKNLPLAENSNAYWIAQII